jgi:hypothetical protein
MAEEAPDPTQTIHQVSEPAGIGILAKPEPDLSQVLVPHIPKTLITNDFLVLDFQIPVPLGYPDPTGLIRQIRGLDGHMKIPLCPPLQKGDCLKLLRIFHVKKFS